MKKKKFLRLSKRLLIMLLCTSLIFGACFNRYKIKVNAAATAVTTYTLYEICLYLGSLIAAGVGIGTVIDNRDELAKLGKDFIDSVDLSGIEAWMFSKVDITGQSYVYGTDALKEAKETAFEVIQGGGNSPENNEDNDGDGDKDFDDRTEELKNFGFWATSYCMDWLCDALQPKLDEVYAGQENFITDAYGLNDYCFEGYKTDAEGNYLYSGNYVIRYIENASGYSAGDLFESCSFVNYNSSSVAYYTEPYVMYYDGVQCGMSLYRVCKFNGEKLINASFVSAGKHYESNGDVSTFEERFRPLLYSGLDNNGRLYSFNCNVPIFSSYAAALAACQTGDFSEAINASKTYQIADWLQENWTSAIEALNTGIYSLYDNMLIVGEAVNQAMLNQLNGLGYIEALLAQIAAAFALGLPGTLQDPIYIPGDSPVPKLEPGDFPWPVPVPDPVPVVPGVPAPEDPEPPDDPDPPGADPKSTFGLNTIFGILILLIMIIIMLLIIFISCLAFIVMVFRIEATTGFLPDEMVAALDYLKTLQIPGFGMSVYSFFMALIYILLIFSVVGILRKNIDKIKFPRPRKG